MTLPNMSFLITGYILLMVQTHPFLPFGRNGVRPDLILILVIYIGLNYSKNRGALLLCFLGYLFELVSGAPHGLYILIYLFSFCIIKILKKYFNFETFGKRFAILLVCSFTKFCILQFCFYFIYETGSILGQKPFFQETLFTLILFPFVFTLLNRIPGQQKNSSDFLPPL